MQSIVFMQGIDKALTFFRDFPFLHEGKWLMTKTMANPMAEPLENGVFWALPCM